MLKHKIFHLYNADSATFTIIPLSHVPGSQLIGETSSRVEIGRLLEL